MIRLSLDRVYGVIATGGRRPLPVSGSAPRLPGRSDAAAGRVRLAGGQPGQQVAEQPLLLRTERGEQLGLRSIALGGHLALDGVAGSRQQRDAGAPVTARRGRG